MRQQIAQAAKLAGRDSDLVKLIAVSKTQPVSAVEQALNAGQKDFGENYLQEALVKIGAISDESVRWHFIGKIQANKTRDLATHFHWIHTVEREKIARRLNDQCPSGKVLNVCLQVNVDRDPNKAGIMPEQAGSLLATCAGMNNLRVRGLMTILDPRADALASYNRLHQLFEQLAAQAQLPWDTLSMGMSGDLAAAIAAGATHVRIGTAIFGPRLVRQARETQA